MIENSALALVIFLENSFQVNMQIFLKEETLNHNSRNYDGFMQSLLDLNLPHLGWLYP